MCTLNLEDSDQSKFSRGIRDIDNKRGDGKFVELEQNPSDRRDPEESRYDEAGRPIFTQGDEEMVNFEKALEHKSAAATHSEPKIEAKTEIEHV